MIEKVDVPELDIIDKENVSESASLDVNNPPNFANDDMAANDAPIIIMSKNLPQEISEIKEEDDESQESEEENKIEKSN